MRSSFVVAVLALVSLAIISLPGVIAPGVTICGVQYACNCGVSDGICPDTYASVGFCVAGDLDCGTCGVYPPFCSSGFLDGDETGVDCGGSCPACPVPLCSNGVFDPGETGIDCGGTCPACSGICGDGNVDAGTETCDGGVGVNNCGTWGATAGGGPGLVCTPPAWLNACTYGGCFTPNGQALIDPDGAGINPPFQCLVGSGVAGGRCCPNGNTWNGVACVPAVVPENTLPLCNNNYDDDADGSQDWEDVSPSYLDGQSCNVCTATACQGLNAANVPYAWPANGMPVAAGTTFVDATAAQQGDPANFRIDWDGSTPTGSCYCAQCTGAGYSWDAGSSACVQAPPSCAQLSITANDIQFVPISNAAPGSTNVRLDYTINAPWPTTHYIEWYSGATLRANYSETPANSANIVSSSALVNGLPVGTHVITARLYANCDVASAESSFLSENFVVNPAAAPVVSFVALATPDWQAANVTYVASWSHPNPVDVRLDRDDGSADLVLLNVPGPGPNSLLAPDNFHQYTLAIADSQAKTPTLTVTDSSDATRTTQVPFAITLTSYGRTPGCPGGCEPLINLPEACDLTTSCAMLNSLGVIECVLPIACFPNNGTICIAPDNAKDRDDSIFACEYDDSTTLNTCKPYQWSTLPAAPWVAPANAMCCGDDANEFPATTVFDAGGGTKACCSAANMCFSSRNAACIVQTGENDALTCGDGIDNDCDGKVDDEDDSCAAQIVEGYVTLNTDQGPAAALDAVVTLGGVSVAPVASTTSPQGATQVGTQYAYYSFTQPAQITALKPGKRILAASRFGYTTETTELTLAVGDRVRYDFTLEPRLCNDDCTNQDGYCDRSCIGVGACQPANAAEISTINACHPAGAPFGLKAGQEVTISYDPVREEALVGVCCAMMPAVRKAPKTLVSPNPSFGTIDTLVKYTTTVVINGRPYKFIVNTW